MSQIRRWSLIQVERIRQSYSWCRQTKWFPKGNGTYQGQHIINYKQLFIHINPI